MLVDAHLDLAMNAMEWNRDLSRPIAEIRDRERGMTDKPDRGLGTVSFGELRRGGIGLVVATQIARFVAPGNPLPGWHSQEQAWAMTQAQLAWYREMEARGELVQIRDRASLDAHVNRWEASTDDARPIGYILSLEGADSIVTLRHLERAYEAGLRAVGPGHYGPGVYAQGTNATGDLGPRGRELLQEIARLGIILDVTHLCDDSLRDAFDHYDGPLWASHSNCRALVPHNRQLSDDHIREIVRRGGVIGAAFDAWMLVPGWDRARSSPRQDGVSLATVVDHIDHICQIAGSARHCGLGTDLDGAFGREQCPYDVETIADLSRLPGLLASRGYSADDVAAIGSGNFLRLLRSVWR
jgi:membrane dipeptidase